LGDSAGAYGTDPPQHGAGAGLLLGLIKS
jgi:hypothetical protein